MNTGNYHFIWLTKPLSECLLCGGSIHVDETQLVLQASSRDAVFSGLFGRCIQCRCWYGLLYHLEEMVIDAGWKSHDIRAMYIKEKRLNVGAWLGPGFGLMSWIELMQKMDQYTPVAESPPPTVDEVLAVEQLPENWEMGVCVGDWVAEQEGDPELSYVAVVVDGLGVVRHFLMQSNTRQGPDQLTDLVFEAIARPHADVSPGRPQMLYLQDERLVRELQKRLNPVDIKVEKGPTPLLDEALEAMLMSFRKTNAVPYLHKYSEETVRDYFQAARVFYQARPWMRFEGTKYLAVKFNDSSWQYFNIIGQSGEEPGITYFEDWLQICRFIQNYDDTSSDSQRPIRAAGALEGITLMPPYALHPVDADYIKRLGIRPVKRNLFPTPHRFLPDPEVQSNPVCSLSSYTLLMEGLVDILASRRSFHVTSIKKTMTVRGIPVKFRYPTNAKESYSENPGSYRLIVEGTQTSKNSELLPPGSRIEIDASGVQRIDDVAHAIKRQLGKEYEVDGFFSGIYYLWCSATGRATATPRVGHLSGVKDLNISIGLERYPMRVMRSVGTVPVDLQIKRIPS